MLKIIYTLAIISLICIGIIYLVKIYPKNLVQPLQPSPSEFVQNAAFQKIDYQDKSYAVFAQKITHPQKLSLILNFSQQLTSDKIMSDNECNFLTNAGFYTPDYQPLGLLIIDGKQINPVSLSPLLTGFFTKHRNNTLTITSDPPIKEVEFTFQSGPLILPHSQLKIINDEPARRILIAHTGEYEWFLLAITQKDNFQSGPFLADLPAIFAQIQLNIIQALNLDGGAASTFWQDQGITLNELVPVGSFLCEKINPK